MSDETQNTEPTVQCAQCGLNGYPPPACEDCHGKAAVEARQYTASELRSGRGPKEDERYGLHGEVGPKIVTNLPGAGGLGGV